MNIQESYNLKGGKSTEALSGAIVFDEALGEFRQTKIVGGVPVVTFRMDGNGIAYYNDNGTIANKIDAKGNHFYDSNGIERISTGLDSTGKMRMIFRNANGVAKIIIGQNPKDGNPVIAVTKPDTAEEIYDVEEELMA